MHSVFSKCPTKLSARFSNLDGSRSIRVSRCSNSSRPRGMKRIDEESLSGYIPETYCPIEPGGKLGPSYTALVKLGYGRTSTTWLCKDHMCVSSPLLKFTQANSPTTAAPTKSSKSAQSMLLVERRQHSRESDWPLRTQSTAAAFACADQNASSNLIAKDRCTTASYLSLSDRIC